jgi:MoxR-like ATPase
VLALLRGRGHVVPQDVHDLATDVLRHRIVLSYDALSEGVTADQLLERVLAAVAEPGSAQLMRETPPVIRAEGVRQA